MVSGINVTGDIRAVFEEIDDNYVEFVDIGSHLRVVFVKRQSCALFCKWLKQCLALFARHLLSKCF